MSKHSWNVPFIDLLIVFILCWLTASSGLFDIRSVTDAASRDIFYRAWSVSYPKASLPKTTVVLFNDASLGESGSWPAPYESHAAFLRALVPLRPRSVFFDIAFIDERSPNADPTLQNLIEAVVAADAAGIKVFFASASAHSGARRPIRREFQQLADNGKLTLVSIEASEQSERYPLVNLDSNPPAAKALYLHYCQESRVKCASFSGRKEFEVWWAAPPSDLNCLPNREFECPNVSTQPLIRFTFLAAKWVAGSHTMFAPREADPIPLPYHPRMYWGEVVSGQLSDSLLNQIKGSVVFYGTDLALARDGVRTNVSGVDARRELPGVFYHAMAFDNMATLGDDVIRPEAWSGLSSQAHGAALAALCCFAIYIKRVTSSILGLRLAASGRGWIGGLSDWLVFYVTLLAIAMIDFCWFRATPSNWIGLVSGSVVGLAAQASNWSTRLQAFGRFLRRTVQISQLK